MISKNKIKYIRSLDLKKNRMRDGVFVAEGRKLVADLLKVFEPVYVAATEEWEAPQGLPPADDRQLGQGFSFDTVTADELCRISFQETPQQVLAIFRQPTWDADMAEVAARNLCLALDDVQNPGNLGTIVRLADWFGIEHIFCGRGCADVYNPKTMQATMGGIAHVQVHYVDLPSALASLSADTPIYGTFLDGDNIYAKPLQQRGVIVMGNEGRGVSPEVASLVTERLCIPNYPAGRPTAESLNVAIATAVVCSEFRRRG